MDGSLGGGEVKSTYGVDNFNSLTKIEKSLYFLFDTVGKIPINANIATLDLIVHLY